MDRNDFLLLALTHIGFLILLITLVAVLSEGASIVVDQTGEGDHVMIRSAVENAIDGDQILIRSGYYNESVDIKKELFIRGMDRQWTMIEGHVEFFDVNEADGDSMAVI